MLASDVVDQPRGPGTRALHPFKLVVPRPGTREQTIRKLPGGLRIARLSDREPAHERPAHTVHSLAVFVLPRACVTRARCEHVHIVTLADLLGEQPACVLRAG